MSNPWTKCFLLALVAALTLDAFGKSDEKKRDTPVKGRTVILGTWSWAIETNKQGDENSANVWWQQISDKEQFLVPQNGSRLAVVSKKEFDKITREDLVALKYTDKKVPNEALTPGTVLAVRTKEGNFAKLKVVKYRALHDFTFPEAKYLDAEWMALALMQPNTKNYHLEVDWILYRK